MTNNKTTPCSVCGQPIKTMSGAVALNRAPVVCRRCFGEQSYDGSSHWSYNVMIQGQSTPES